jgi:hypothetical protein
MEGLKVGRHHFHRGDFKCATYEPTVIGIPSWVYDRICSMGLTGAAASFRSLAASALEDGDNKSADAYTMWTIGDRECSAVSWHSIGS